MYVSLQKASIGDHWSHTVLAGGVKILYYEVECKSRFTAYGEIFALIRQPRNNTIVSRNVKHEVVMISAS